jgi:hypothetical protein
LLAKDEAPSPSATREPNDEPEPEVKPESPNEKRARRKFVHRPLTTEMLERRLRAFREYRQELRRINLPEDDWWSYPGGVGFGC